MPSTDRARREGGHRAVVLATGNEMIAAGALAAGCRFFSGYPITPASEIYAEMMRRLPAAGGVALGAPDEISALSYAVGASLAGARAMTATSGPGWSLMIETAQYALMTETPVVIVVSQRLGPATGGATQSAQGDVLFVAHANSGGYPVPVLCPVDAIDAYAVTIRAFDWAERLRTPVIVLTDKETSKTMEAVPLEALPRPLVGSRPSPADDRPYVPYAIEALEDVPAFAPVGGPHKVTVTGSAHDSRGLLRKNDPETLRQLAHLRAKIEARAEELAWVRERGEREAETLVVSYGSSARACRAAAARLRQEGVAVRLLEVLSLFPVPAGPIAEAARGASRVVVVEENGPGLYARELRAEIPGLPLRRVNAVGRPIDPAEICAEVRR
ncbi:MAG: pyruvate flavodoxin/ferredoxin oxidoreductase [Acidobacteria bacterium]|nr:MAG: pyruvate flavodoxin/ferredoxin oxidoreductase [Acidobacteriota bacterium]